MTNILTPFQINEYVKSHGVMTSKGQVRLTKPLFVFKKVCIPEARRVDEADKPARPDRDGRAIANLVIPVGATVNLCRDEAGGGTGSKKLRASQAYCHSIVALSLHDQKINNFQLDTAYSIHKLWFRYTPGIGGTSPLTTADFMNVTLNHERKHPAFKKCKLVPQTPFSRSKRTCDSGIHFFIELQTAKDY